MNISRRRTFLATTSAIALGATVGLLVPAPAKADCTAVGFSVTCTGTTNESQYLPFAYNLTNTGTLAVTGEGPAVFSESFNVINNPGTISVTGNAESLVVDLGGDGFNYESFLKSTAIRLGTNSTLNNSGTVTATNTFTADISNSDAESFYNFTVIAIGVTSGEGLTTINNSGTISASATHSLALTNVASANVEANAFAAGILTLGFDPVFNNPTGLITATASNSFTFNETSSFNLNGPSSGAAGIVAPEFAQIVNDGTITASASTTFNFTSVEGFEVYGPNGAWAVPTTGAAGIQAFYFANITNNGTINATATTTATLSNSSGGFFGSYCCSGNGQEINTLAFGVYVGPTILPPVEGSPTYFFNDPQLSSDLVVNTGTINATATSTFTFNNTSGVDVYTNTAAIGVLLWYPVSSSSAVDYEGFLTAVATVNNSGTINATANASFTSNLSDSYGSGSINVQSFAAGIVAAGGDRGLSSNFSIGGGEGGGVIATIINSGAINATAHTTIAISAIDNSESFYSLNGQSVAFGVLASGFFQENCCGPSTLLGPSVTNSGTITASATTSIPITIGGAEGNNSIYANIYGSSFAAGIVTWPMANITNSGTITATAVTALTATIANDSYASLSGLTSLYSEAVGISIGQSFESFSIPCCGYNSGNVTNTGTITVSALTAMNVAADATSSSFVEMSLNSRATGIGGAEGTNALNSGTISAVAASTFVSTGNVFGFVGLSSTAYGINTDAYSTITNSGIITASALSSFSATAGGGEISSPPNASMNAFAVGIAASGYYGYNTINNSGTIAVEANVTLNLSGFTGMEGGGEFEATAKGILAGGYNLINNDGIITVLATVTINTPNYAFYGYAGASAYGIVAWGEYNNVTNNGSIGVLASLNITSAEIDSFTSEGYSFNYSYGVNSSPARAFGIKVGNFNVVLNTGSIIVESSVTVNGTTLSGDTDPSASFGIYGKAGNTITNQGLIATTRIGPNHWAVFLDTGDYDEGSTFFNQPNATTIGSIYVGSNSSAYNFGTMTFRVLPPPASAPVAPFGTYDRIVVGTNGTFDTAVPDQPQGTLLIAPKGGQGLYAQTTTYRYFVDAQNFGNGSGNTVNIPATSLKTTSAYFVASLAAPSESRYGNDTNSYDLILTRVSFAGPLQTDLVGNQSNVGQGLEGAFNGASNSPNSAFANFLSHIQALPPGTPASAYQQLAGENGANAGALGAINSGQLLGVLFGRLGSLQGGFLSASSSTMQVASPSVQLASAARSFDLAQAAPGAPSSSRSASSPGDVVGWMSGYGQTSQIDSQPGISGARYNVAGGMLGIEKQFTEMVRAGFAVGGGTSWINIHGVDSRANGKFFQGALYGGLTTGPWYVDGAAAYTFHSISTERNVAFPGFTDNLKADFHAHQFIGGLEGGYNMQWGRHRITPFVGLQLSVFSQSGYTESGGASALSFASNTTTSVRGMVGAQFRTSFMMNGTMRIDPFVRIAWGHEFADRAATVSASFVGAPTSSFNVLGAKRDRDSALIGTGFELATSPRFTVFAAYNGDLTGNSTSHAGTIGLRYRW